MADTFRKFELFMSFLILQPLWQIVEFSNSKKLVGQHKPPFSSDRTGATDTPPTTLTKRSINPDSDNIPFLQPVPEHPIKINEACPRTPRTCNTGVPLARPKSPPKPQESFKGPCNGATKGTAKLKSFANKKSNKKDRPPWPLTATTKKPRWANI